MYLRYVDVNNNVFIINGTTLFYKAVKAIESSSGNYSGGRDEIKSLKAAEIEQLKLLLESLTFSTESAPRTKGRSLLYYKDHEFSFAFNSTLQNQFDQLLKTCLKEEAKQLEHQDYHAEKHDLQISLVLDGVSSTENLAMAMRLADSFGVKDLFLLHSGIDQINAKIDRISRQSSKHLNINFYTNTEALIDELNNLEQFYIALESTDRSIDIELFNSLETKRIAIIIGSEQNGVSPALLKLSQVQLHIPMYGINSSMNVMHALAIGLHHCVGLR